MLTQLARTFLILLVLAGGFAGCAMNGQESGDTTEEPGGYGY